MANEPVVATLVMRFKALIQQAGLKWEAFQLPVRSDALCISIPCDVDKVQDTIGNLFAAIRTIEDRAHREEVVATLASLQTETYDGNQVFIYWPNLLVSDLP
jgi:hypothetical protein